jgi:hypothetical protein
MLYIKLMCINNKQSSISKFLLYIKIRDWEKHSFLDIPEMRSGALYASTVDRTLFLDQINDELNISNRMEFILVNR